MPFKIGPSSPALVKEHKGLGMDRRAKFFNISVVGGVDLQWSSDKGIQLKILTAQDLLPPIKVRPQPNYFRTQYNRQGKKERRLESTSHLIQAQV